MKKLKNIKIIFIDIDGTLTNNQKKVTSINSKSIENVIKKGIKVVITSGRNYIYSTNISKQANASPIVISSDGSIIYNYDTQEVLYANYIDSEKVEKIYDFAEKNKIGLLLNSKDYVYCNNYAMNVEYYKVTFLAKENLKQNNICQIVLIKGIKNKLEEIMKLIEDLNLQISYFTKSFSNQKYGDTSIDIINKNASKGESIKYLLKELDIKKEESLCIGDYDNDLEMFDVCGFKVAMGNASEKIKEKADYITLSNEENGVAYFLDNFI